MKSPVKIFLVAMYLLVLGASTVLLLRSTDRDIALQECIDEVSNKCKSLFNYAVSLEEENARLNKELRKCMMVPTDWNEDEAR